MAKAPFTSKSLLFCNAQPLEMPVHQMLDSHGIIQVPGAATTTNSSPLQRKCHRVLHLSLGVLCL